MKKRSGLWDYLDKSGVLERGQDDEIRAVKKEYRKKYLLEFKRNQRAKHKEITIRLNAFNGELSSLSKAAKQHRRSLPEFIKSAVNAYLEQKYLVPDLLQVAQLEQLLVQTLNEVQEIAGRRGNYYGMNNEILKGIERQIELLETEINRIFRNPQKVTFPNDSQSQIT